MYRTRDLVLGLLVAGFFSLVVLVAAGRGDDSTNQVSSVLFGEGVTMEETVVPQEDSELDREANRERLRALVAERGEVIVADPSDDIEEIETSEVAAGDDVPATATIVRCLQPDDSLALVGRWPFREARFAVREGARVIVHEQLVTTPGLGTSSDSTTVTEQVLLQLPLQPQALTSSHCVPSEVVGVTIAGQLIFNQDLRPYVGYGADDLIGYARDGYPMYGTYEGSTDACGGYEHPTGYRYSLTEDRDFIVGCFTATPQNITIE